MLRISSTVAMARSTMISKAIGPAMPFDMSSPKLFWAGGGGVASASTLSIREPSSPSVTPYARADRLPHAGEQVVLGLRAVHHRVHQLVVLGGPRLALDVQRGAEPRPVRVDLRGVGAQ